MDDQEIPESQSATFLGVTFDKHLSWMEHLQKTITKAKGACNILKSFAGIKWGSHPKYLLTIYKGFVRAILEWGVLCYLNANKQDLNRLD